jgi:hypothetical protein
MAMCYTCIKFVDNDHECPTAKKLIENPVDLTAPFLHSSAVPTRTGPDSFKVRRG